MLATMLDPDDDDGYLHFKLELAPLATKRRGPLTDLDALDTAVDYRKGLQAGKNSFDAAWDTAEKFRLKSGRTVYRHQSRWKKVTEFLRGDRRRTDTK